MAHYLALVEGDSAPKLSRALGDMILAWTSAEERQAFAVASMLDIPPDTAIVLYQKFPNFRSRTQAIYAMIGLHPAFESIKKPVEKLSALSKTRNRYVHCTYLHHEDDLSDIRSIDYGQLLGSPERSKPVKAADISNHAKAVLKRSDQLNQELWKIPQYRAWIGTNLPDWKEPLGPQSTQQ